MFVVMTTRALLLCSCVGMLMLSACSTVRGEREWHGQELYFISCSGLFSSWNQCFSEAMRRCDNGRYSVVAQSNQAGDDGPEYLLGINPAGYVSRDLVVLCNPSANVQAGHTDVPSPHWLARHLGKSVHVPADVKHEHSSTQGYP